MNLMSAMRKMTNSKKEVIIAGFKYKNDAAEMSVKNWLIGKIFVKLFLMTLMDSLGKIR